MTWEEAVHEYVKTEGVVSISALHRMVKYSTASVNLAFGYIDKMPTGIEASAVASVIKECTVNMESIDIMHNVVSHFGTNDALFTGAYTRMLLECRSSVASVRSILIDNWTILARKEAGI